MKTADRILQRREEFKDLKFGMFIHWSLFSLSGGHNDWRTPRDAIRELHSYEVPEVLALDVKDGDPSYMRWLTECLDEQG